MIALYILLGVVIGLLISMIVNCVHEAFTLAKLTDKLMGCYDDEMDNQ